MNKWKKPVLVLFLIVLVGPVLAAQFSPDEGRDLEGISLASLEYREISFTNPKDQTELAGLLFLPEGEGPFPAAVIIPGSGSSRRDNPWYLTLTGHLQENGVAVLLPDKRGSAQSGGDWRSASLQELAGDTTAAITYLQDQEMVDLSRIGVIGMSQGGMIAPITVQNPPRPEFIVNVVGGAVPMHAGLVYEENHNLREMGVLTGISNVLAYPAAWSLIYLRQAEFWSAVGNFDPLPYWDQVPVDSLILYGAEDTNLPSRRSARRLRSLDNPHLEVVVYDGSGHALESPPDEGNRIFREDALERITSFIQSGSPAP